jgi:N-acetylglucosaminyldiphosphoundecaprenol N-acetyl-beta-D-mannosaminyltransferase
VRRLGLEWLARLIREPWRWRRQTVLPVYAILAFGEAARTRLGRR